MVAIEHLAVLVYGTMPGLYSDQRGPVGIIDCQLVLIECRSPQAMMTQLHSKLMGDHIARMQDMGTTLQGYRSVAMWSPEDRPRTSSQLAYEIGRAAEQLIKERSELVAP